ncbi:hypothetical protein A0J61_06546 [Choanephora cucurbitarum]|uniref:Uncharacterized protein n=1 Tax=Choanephora cucurbitarum TaxID=101091 RepID=A0A1C7N9Q5_9FUNG|nr:hypothetical protein A0J61_06546 [Choanephora cucurbitarum]
MLFHIASLITDTAYGLDLIESPNNSLKTTTIKRTAVVHSTITIINWLFPSLDVVVELGWLEISCFSINRTK